MSNETEYIIIERYKTFTQQFTKYAGTPLYIICLYGTIMNMLMFSQRLYRYRSGSLYLLIASLCDFIYLNLGPLPNILQYGFQHQSTMTSRNFCKFKSYFAFVITAISATLTCLTNINQYLLSSRKNQRWKYGSTKIARRAIPITILIWFILSIPIAFCYKLSEDEQFICLNPLKTRFCYIIHLIYICLINGFLHPFIMIFFGICTYKNINHIQKKSYQIRQINYQMTLMLVLQSIKSSFSSIPFALFNCYLLITIDHSKSLLYQRKENLIKQMLYFLFWSNYTSFFVYIYSSKIFKEHWKKLMKKIFCFCFFIHKKHRKAYNYQLKTMNIRQTIVNLN